MYFQHDPVYILEVRYRRVQTVYVTYVTKKEKLHTNSLRKLYIRMCVPR